MGYSVFGKVKTIVIPIGDFADGLTIDEYKEVTGIDLNEFLTFGNSGGIDGIKSVPHTEIKIEILKNGEDYSLGVFPATIAFANNTAYLTSVIYYNANTPTYNLALTYADGVLDVSEI